MKVYKIKENQVVEVECKKKEYLQIDSDGDIIYENTHFETKKEAYIKLIEECEAGINVYTGQLIDARDKVRRLESKLADDCIILQKIREEFKKH